MKRLVFAILMLSLRLMKAVEASCGESRSCCCEGTASCPDKAAMPCGMASSENRGATLLEAAGPSELQPCFREIGLAADLQAQVFTARQRMNAPAGLNPGAPQSRSRLSSFQI